VLQLATNGTTTALTLDASQNATFAGTLTTTGITNSGVATATRFNPTGSSVTGNGMYLPAANSLGLSTNGTNAVYIDTSQNVGIGTTTPDVFSRGYTKTVGISSSGSTALQINSTGDYPAIELGRGGVRKFVLDAQSTVCELASLEAVPMAFSTNSTERMRIDSSGNVGIGATSSGSRFHSESSANQSVGYFKNTNASNTNDGIQVAVSRNTTDGSYRAFAYYNAGAGAYKFWVLDSGNCQNTNGSYGAFSDIKLKDNIVDATPKLASLMQVKVRNYNLKSDPTFKQIGVIAQELEQVFPAMVEESTDRDSEGNDLGTKTKAVKYSVFVPMLVKAIQELKAINDTQAETINALTARIVAIESRGTV
jgi:hypothetical protein